MRPSAAHDLRPPAEGTGRYPLIGGVASWRVPVLAALLAAGALALDVSDLAAAVAILGWLAHGLCRSVVLEISPVGITRGFVLNGDFRGPATVLSWPLIAEVHTSWCRPRDESALQTIVRASDGVAVRFSTAMGLAAYWTCLAEVVRRTPGAVRSGLTDAVLADGPPARSHLLSAMVTAAALALILLALVGLYHVWAQGASWLSRYLADDDVSGAWVTPGRLDGGR
jgi:hypothetical protein